MSKLNYLCLILCVLATGWLDAAQPNVVLVITDDQGYGDIGFHGNPEIQTPTIDSLARSSLRLTNFHVEPTCAETRAALLTGQYPLRGGVWHTVMGRSILRSQSTTLAQFFKKAGYRTGMFGKWHLGDNYPYRPQDRGFDVTLNHGGGGVSQTPDVWGNDYFDDVYWSGDKLQPTRGYCTDVFFDAAQDFIAADSQQPFFCYLATNAPHSPYNVAEPYKKPYLDRGIEEPRASFYGMITNIDDNLSKLLKQLDDRGIAQDTIVIFMTDNGSAAGFMASLGANGVERGFNAGMRATKGSQYDGGHRVPCFIRYAKSLPTDRSFDQLCAHIDLLPTLARLCNFQTDSGQSLDGRDLVDYVNDVKPWSDRTHFVQSHRVEEPAKYRKSAILTDRWRLVDGEELYDMQADPGQQKPLPKNEHANTIASLRASYDAWWEQMMVEPTQFSNIQLGATQAPRVRLTGHDWHGPQPIWSQDFAAKDPLTNGFWAIEVARPGTYQFLLSRRPLDAPAPLLAVRAKVLVGGQSAEVNIDPTAVVAPVTMHLEAGVNRLTTKLTASDGSVRGAYFVTVNYLGELTNAELLAGSQLPSWIKAGDRIAWLGGTLVERAAGSGALETEVLLRSPLAGLTFVNLGWSGDDFSGRARAVFGAGPEGKARRLTDIKNSGASLVAIAYGMSELLDESFNDQRLKFYESELDELVASLKAESLRSVICLPPKFVDDIEGSAAVPLYRATSARYQQHRPAMLEMLRRVAQKHELPVVELPAVSSSQFESGTYLSMQGYRTWAAGVGDAFYQEVPESAMRSRTHEQQLYELASESQRLFFDMHRPENETYLLLFRKHEQGNNAVELGQYRALLAEKQHELLYNAARQ